MATDEANEHERTRPAPVVPAGSAEPAAGQVATVPPREAVQGSAEPVEGRRPDRWRDPYLYVSAVVLLWAVGVAVQHTWTTDFLLHAGTVQALERDLTDPPDPMVGAGHGSPYYSPFVLLAAVLVRLTGASPTLVLAVLGVAGLGVLLWAFRRFCGWFTTSAGAAVALLAMLFLWGVRPPVWSGFLSMRSLAEVLPYPSTTAFALMLLVFDRLLRLRQDRAGRHFVVLGLLAAAILLVHPFTAVNAAIGAVAIVLSHPLRRHGGHGWGARDLGRLAAAAVAALLLAAAWPYSSLGDLLTGAPEFAGIHRQLLDDVLDPARLSCAYGLFGLIPLLARLRARRRDPLVLLFALAATVVVAAAVSHQYEFLRAIPIVLLPLHVAFGAFVAGAGGVRARWRGTAAAAAAAVVLAGTAVDVAPFGGVVGAVPVGLLPGRLQAMADTPNLRGPAPKFRVVQAYVPAGAVLFTDDRSADRHLNWLGYFTVNPGWPNPWLDDAQRRTADRRTLLGAGTPPAERGAILARYAAQCALITRTPAVTGSGAVTGYRLVHTGPAGTLYCR